MVCIQVRYVLLYTFIHIFMLDTITIYNLVYWLGLNLYPHDIEHVHFFEQGQVFLPCPAFSAFVFCFIWFWNVFINQLEHAQYHVDIDLNQANIVKL